MFRIKMGLPGYSLSRSEALVVLRRIQILQDGGIVNIDKSRFWLVLVQKISQGFWG